MNMRFLLFTLGPVRLQMRLLELQPVEPDLAFGVVEVVLVAEEATGNLVGDPALDLNFGPKCREIASYSLYNPHLTDGFIRFFIAKN